MAVRRWLLLVVVAVTCWAVSSCDVPKAPRVIAATGDSIALGYDSCGVLKHCRALSYSTGGGPGVASLYRRLETVTPGLTGRFNYAAVGARMDGLDGQLAAAVRQRADVVTVMMGANDACAVDTSTMTPVEDFRASFRTALDTYFTGRPSGLMLVSSVPSLYRVWQLGRTNPTARWVWQLAHVCPAMLDNPTSNARDDVQRRRIVQQRVDAYNRVLRSECAAYDGCRWDLGAAARYPETADQLSPYDYFHPSRVGQQMLADVTWQRYFG